jgi:TonB-linked SusC/RagA family outer membrane protein
MNFYTLFKPAIQKRQASFKLILFMKCVFFLMTVFCLQASASGYAQQINFSERNTSLKKIFSVIQKQTKYVIWYENKTLEGTNNLNVSLRNATLIEALDACFKDQPLSYTIVNNTIVVQRKNKNNEIQTNEFSVKGMITDEKGLGLPGVTIKLKGSSTTVISSNNGSYSFTAPEGNGILVFSYIGYISQEVSINGKSTINVQLKPANSDLSEVVVVGYGTQKKLDLTGSIASVGSEKLDSRPMTNLGDGLNGLVPNLNVNINNGQPGTGASFNIRNYTTIGQNSSSSPLVLVDGVQRDPNLIDPNDVESVTVLKDAASAAIYGGRAAYGVILITTKTGKKGKTQVSYSGSYTTSRPTKVLSSINSQQYIDIFNSAQRTGSKSGGYTSSEPFTNQDSLLIAAYFRDPANNPNAYVDPGNPKRYRYVGNTDWVKVLYPGWAPQQQHYLSVSGGEGKTTYSANMGYFTQDGLEKVANQVYKRYTPSLKVNSDVTKWLTFNLSMSMTHTDNNKSASTNVNQGGAWIPGDLRPVMPVYHPDGNYSGQGNYTNPIAVINQSGRDIESQNDFWTTGRVILKPIDHLTVTSDYTWNNYNQFDKQHLIPFNEYGVNGAFLDVFPYTNPSRVSEYRQNNNYNAFNAYATYENTFADKHYFKAMAGYNQEYQHYVLSNASANNLIDNMLPAIGANNDPKPSVGGTETQYALIGSFFRLNYVYDKKYLLEINGRYDGTSRFPADHRYAFSPSVSAGWNISEESFMENTKNILNELKIRASYGQLPNQQVSTGIITSAAQYPYIATQPGGSVGYLFNNQQGVTVGVPALISPDLTWEKVQTKNIGLDYALFKNKLSGSFDYFITDTKDMLVAGQQLPATLGTGAPLRNAANLRTQGWELSMTWKDRAFNNQLSYNITLGLSDAYSTIKKYDLNPIMSITQSYPGQRLGDIWGFVTEGFYKTDAEAAAVDNTALAGYKWLAGDIRYADLNNDGKISKGNSTLSDPGDQKIIGNKTPRYKFGFNLGLAYKNFDFTTFIQGVLKADFMPNDYAFYAFQGNEWNIPYQYATDYWTPQNTNAYFARPRFAGSGNQQAQTKFLQNAAYARIKQLTLGYSLPTPLINKLNIQKVRFYVTGANLFTITSLFKAYDPEMATNGFGYQVYPINKSVSFGLQVTL